MNTAPASPTIDHAAILDEVIAMATDLARAAHRKALAETDPMPLADATIIFDRIARAIRRSIALARKLTEPVPDRQAARASVIRTIEDNIQRHADPREAESLQTELYERLDDPELEDDLTTRPVGDIITEICRDLGLAALPGTDPWVRRTPADITLLRARAAAKPGHTATPGLKPRYHPPQRARSG